MSNFGESDFRELNFGEPDFGESGFEEPDFEMPDPKEFSNIKLLGIDDTVCK